MTHETALVATLAMCLGLALPFGYAATRIRIHSNFGYLLAGAALAPLPPGLRAVTLPSPRSYR